MEQFSRTELLLRKSGLERLQASRIAVFGVGGVGGFVCEALVRSGLGAIDIVDNDVVSVSNINRQIIATHASVGRPKVEVMAERLREINPDVRVTLHPMFYLPENAGEIDLSQFDYVVDAIDTVTAKLELISRCTALQVPIISAMGAGNKLDPTKLLITDIYQTTACPLSRIMRKECRKRGIPALKVAFSTEEPVPLEQTVSAADRRRDIPGSAMFVPASMGLMIASHIVQEISGVHAK